MNSGPNLKERRLSIGLTLEDVAKIVGVGRSTVRKWETGDIENMKRDKIALLARALKVSPLWVMGIEDDASIIPFKTKKVPLLGTIAAGEPIYADEQCEAYIEIDQDVRVDFCVRVKGDSMIDARIKEGDLVFIRQQPEVEAGEIAAVLIDNDVTLKRFYKNDKGIILKPENRKYQPRFYTKEDFKEVRVLGKAVLLQGKVY